MPSVINIRPTRLEYIRTKRRIIVAKKGLKLLKLKRQALILEFFNTSKTVASLRSGLQIELVKGYQAIRMAEMLAGAMRLENEAMKIPQLNKLQITPKNVMGVRIPKIEGGKSDQVITEHLLELPPSINEAIKAFRNVHKMVLDVAEKETTLRKLLLEIEKTKRKSNAIENVFIPRLQAAIKFIIFRLDEMERDTFMMLKTVKRKMGEREQESLKLKEKEILA
ncbi:V-type ATP synthase subunit D [Candidatus Nitrosotalea okcheonensis]|uniref:A-type ATP synthase subunit D n=1 Tax=Candidatus Nitrosotalea okcheonensis TaxID=1903276 RepID=A0A2H1FGT2_9ARCH|nr:V-type ATP synthase subunit D [Candidatus Nitrosotalea okcheonensis]MDE1727999.1 V-type ATP synthase subunit D [Nitrososphaerota archaeon]MDE1878331.1 V-type ATP synthase subunit D [Nitrososphaerota archaeon]SMH71969.1 V-type ATP synthase subunit D [Candidatus Nitrosotalea okcheonensis]